MTFVLDCSVAMAWGFEDEHDQYATRVLDLLTERPAVVPSIWPLEVANTILVGERKGRLTNAEAGRFHALLEALPISVEVSTTSKTLSTVLPLARKHGLTAYDASYLDLAVRLACPLATFDKALLEAAKAVGVSLLPA